MTQQYCCNDNCAEYSDITIEQKPFCNDCIPDKYNDVLTSTFLMYKTKKLLNPSKKIETIDLTKDSKLIKHVLSTGVDNTPENGQQLTVHYTGRLLDGTVFDSSVNRGQPFQFILGQQQVIPMWDIGFASMKKGEKSILIGHSDLAYGDQGAPPNIPGESTLCFEVELIDFGDKPKEIFEMTSEEKIQHMLEYKEIAKKQYIDGKIDEAYMMFKKSLDHLCDESHDDKIHLLVNLSICASKLEQWQQSLQYSDQALKIDKNNIKALYRTAFSLFHLNELEDTIQLCKHILSIDNENNNVKILLQKSIQKNKIIQTKTRSMCKRMFA